MSVNTLAYATRPPLGDRLRALAVREFAGIALVAGGFVFARTAGRQDPPLAHIGAVLIVLGSVWYAASRIQRRTWMSRAARVQLFLASMVCLAGVLDVLRTASHAREGPAPDTLTYWLTSNQTYIADSRVALRRGWTTIAGLVWFATVVVIDRVRHWRSSAPACPRPHDPE